MFTPKRLLLMLTALIALAATTAILFSQLSSLAIPAIQWVSWGIFLAITVLCGIWGVYIWHRHVKMIHRIHGQLRLFERENRIGMIMVDTRDELAGLVAEINRYLTNIKFVFEKNNRDKKELRLQVEAAEAERRQAEAVIESITDAVLVTNRYEELQAANPAAEDLFDFEMDQCFHLPIDQVLTDPQLLRMIRMAHREKSCCRDYALDLVHPVGGRTVNLKVSVASVLDDKQQVIGGVLVAHDITRERELNRLKDDFVNSVSHELKTPLASIQAYAEMIADNEVEDDEMRRKFCGIIQEQAERLNRLIDDILNTSRLESGLLEISRQTVPFAQLFQTAIEAVLPQAEKKKIAIHLEVEPPGLAVSADADLLYQAVLNLLHNAVKYSPEGRNIFLYAGMDGHDHAVVRIEDQGVGIPPDALEHIFTKFYRVPRKDVYVGGTGLGLHLVREIIQKLHQGQIKVQSRLNEGTVFTITLPGAKVPQGVTS